MNFATFRATVYQLVLVDGFPEKYLLPHREAHLTLYPAQDGARNPLAVFGVNVLSPVLKGFAYPQDALPELRITTFLEYLEIRIAHCAAQVGLRNGEFDHITIGSQVWLPDLESCAVRLQIFRFQHSLAEMFLVFFLRN